MNPTSSRTITIPSDAELQDTLVLQWPSAQPSSNLDYWIDLRNVTDFTDSVVSFTVAASDPAGLTINPISVGSVSSNLIVGAYITGGTLETLYSIQFTVTLQSGRIYTRSIYLPIGNVTVTQGGGNGGGSGGTILLTSETLGVTGSGTGSLDVELLPIGVTAGTYGRVTVDAFGRVTAGYLDSYTGPIGTVTNVGLVSTNLSVSNSPITTTGTFNVSLPSVVAAGTYTSVTVDVFGRVISGSNSGGGGGGGQSFLVEEDGLSEFILEDGSGALLTEASS